MKEPQGHYHTLVLAECNRDPDADDLADELRDFFPRLVHELDMHMLIQPQIQLGEFGFTGIAGIAKWRADGS